MFWRLGKIIPPPRNSESEASGNKCSSKDPDDQIWDALMENQVKPSCFSPLSVHLEILLKLFWCLLDKNQSRFDSQKTREAPAEGGRLYNNTKPFTW